MRYQRTSANKYGSGLNQEWGLARVMLLANKVILGTVVMLERAMMCAKKASWAADSRSQVEKVMLDIVLP